MSFDKIKNIILQYCQHLGFISTPEREQAIDTESVPTASKPSYPPEFLENAQNLLDKGMLLEYAELLLHNYQPPERQQAQWSQLVVGEIHSGNFDVINQLIRRDYRFNERELLNLFEKYAIRFYNSDQQEIGKYLKKHIEPAVPLILERILKDIKKIKYSISFDEEYPSSSSSEVEKKAHLIEQHTSGLRQIWKLIEHDNRHAEGLLNIINFYNATLIDNYAANIKKYSFFRHMERKISELQVLKNEVLNGVRNADTHKDKLAGMTEFLKEQQTGEDVLQTAQEIYKKTAQRTQKLEPHIQRTIDQLSTLYKTLAHSKDPEVAFESKNVMEKTVPQLLSVYLSFPENYRTTFKNDKGQSPEELLVIGLSQQMDILKNFEHRALLLKSQELETLNLYGHNKKMALGK